MKKLSFLNISLLFMSGSAFAHPGHGFESASAGFLHPFTGVDHLLVMLAVGVWANQLGRSWRWKLPLTFMLFMLAGMLLSVYGVSLSGLETAIAASVMAMGLLLLMASQLPVTLRLIITGVFAIMHGMAHGEELVTYQYALAATGMFLATGLLHVTGLWLGAQTQPLMTGFKNLMAWSMLFLGAYWAIV